MKDFQDSPDGLIRSAQRTLNILSAMNHRPVSTIAYLHQATGLPKATLVRFLTTLAKMGYVVSFHRGAGYQLTSLVRSLSSGYHSDPLIIEAGRRIAHEVTLKTKWPVSIALPSISGVVVRHSTAADSPMSPFHSTINMHLSFFLRALGRAYVAWCDSDQISSYVRQLQADKSEGYEFANNPEDLASLIASIRMKGYAMRDINIEPTSSNTLAVPIFLDGCVRASIGMTFFRSAVSVGASLERHAAMLKEASRQITLETERLRSCGDVPEFPQSSV